MANRARRFAQDFFAGAAGNTVGGTDAEALGHPEYAGVDINVLRELLAKPAKDVELGYNTTLAQEARRKQLYETSVEPQRREELQADIDLKKAQAAKAMRYTNDKSVNELFKLHGDLAKQAMAQTMKNPMFQFMDPLEQTHAVNVATDIALATAEQVKAATKGGKKPAVNPAQVPTPQNKGYKIGDLSASGAYKLTATGWVPVKK